MTPEEFRREFHSRTLAYQSAFRLDERPVVIVLGDGAHTPTGHALLVSLVNLLARAHQHLVIVGDVDRHLLCYDVFGLRDVRPATVGLARNINPTIVVTTTPAVPERSLLRIGVGPSDTLVDLRMGCDGWCAIAGEKARVIDRAQSIWGAFYAACIAANAAFHRLMGDFTLPSGSYSLWDGGTGCSVQGPVFVGPLDIGRVMQVGAGGVGAALDYWLAYIRVVGPWTIVDGDPVEASNLNQLSFVAADAGYPEPPAKNKAERAAALLGTDHVARWYHNAGEVGDERHDMVLPLANEHGVRAAIQARQQPVILHATTSPRWSAQVHRHIAGVDDCINCRLPLTPPDLQCSTVEVAEDPENDAAVPALSGLAGLLLAVELIRLQHGVLTDTPFNQHSVLLDNGEPFRIPGVSQSCTDGCTGWSDAATRRLISVGERHVALDPARTARPQPR